MSDKKTVFITGSNRGIGRATVEVFASKGWNIIAHARQENEDFSIFLKELSEKYNVEIRSVFFDICDEELVKTQIKNNISKEKIKIHALVNNAGVMDISLFMMTNMENIKEVFDVNLFSHMKVTQLLLKRMSTGSSIVNVASMDGFEPHKGESAYAASKAALIAWTQVLAQEFAGRIRVNAVAPCAVNTDMAHSIADKANWSEDQLLDPKDVANVIYHLCSDDAVGITGDVLKLSGKQIYN